MASSSTLASPHGPAPRAARPVSQVEQSRRVLAGTTAVVSTVLIAWMILAPLFAPARRPLTFLAGAIAAPTALPGAAAGMTDDVKLVARGARAGGAWEVGRREVEQAVGAAVARRGSAPLVVYLAAVGVSGPVEEGTRAYLVTQEGPLGSKKALTPVTDVLGLLRGRKGAPTLLILDAGRVGSDRALGVFGNGFLAQLEPLLRRDGDLVVLASCAPGQVAWSSEPDRRSVFAQYVAEGLSGKAGRWGKVTVQGLYRYVRAGVAHWAALHRDGARQTPILLGNTALDFALPRFLPPAPAPAPGKALEAARAALTARWEARARLAARAPYRHHPDAWSRYQDTLLRAERLVRAGAAEAAEKALAAARAEERDLEAASEAPTPAEAHSLALLDARAGGGATDGASPDPRAAAYRKAIDRALSGREADPAGGGDDPPTSAPEPTPEKPGASEAEAAEKAEADGSGAGAGADATGQADPEPKAGGGSKVPEKAATKEAAPAAPAPAPAAAGGEAPAVPGLTGGRPEAPPTFVEGQVAAWYALFVASGGESESLRRERLTWLRRASAVRAKAERAAADGRALAWVRDLVEQGDALRRQAQDRLFANEQSAFKGAAAPLAQAEGLYDRAAATAAEVGRAIELVQALQDELPALGEWQAFRPDGMDDAFGALLDDAADLAALAYDGPGRGSNLDEARRRLVALTARVGRAREQLADEFRGAVARATGRASSPSWREVDALLRVPSIAPADRDALLDRAAEGPAVSAAGADAPPDPSADPGSDADSEPDPTFWRTARALGRLEDGLLRLAGAETAELEERLQSAWSAHEKAPTLAFDHFDRFSERVREFRTRVARGGRGVGGAGAADEAKEAVTTDRPAEAVRRDLLAADRAARAVPSSWGAAGAAEALDRFRRHELLVWHARRLLDDFAPEHAERLLDDARRLASSKDLWEAFERAHARAAAALVVTGPSPGPDAAARRDIPVSVATDGDVPPGEAVVLAGHDPAVPLSATVGESGSLVTVPTEPGRPVARTLTVRADPRAADGARLGLVPAAFYRGRAFEAEKVVLPNQAGLVKVEIRQQKVLRGIPDQFLLNPGKGYLHTLNSLDYKLVVTNLSKRPVNAHVVYSLEGSPPEKGDLRLEPLGADDSLKGTVLPSDLPDEKAKLLTVNVTEDGPDGRPLCKPLTVPFRKIHPKEFIKAEPGLDGDVFTVWVTHEPGPDPVPLPAKVLVRVEPGNAFRAIGNNFKTIPHGRYAVFKFQILKPVKAVKWTVNAEAVENVAGGTLTLEAP